MHVGPSLDESNTLCTIFFMYLHIVFLCFCFSLERYLRWGGSIWENSSIFLFLSSYLQIKKTPPTPLFFFPNDLSPNQSSILIYHLNYKLGVSISHSCTEGRLENFNLFLKLNHIQEQSRKCRSGREKYG